MTLVTKEQARVITAELKAATEEILARHGFATPTVKTTYGDYFAVKIQSTPVDEGANGVNRNSPEAQSYLLEAKYNEQLDPEALGREITARGEVYVFLGRNNRAPKYPYLARRVSDGKTYKFGVSIESQLGPKA